jgi:hypothetical protein
MTQFVINDLDSSLKLDNQALSNIRGGRSISDFSQYSNIRTRIRTIPFHHRYRHTPPQLYISLLPKRD